MKEQFLKTVKKGIISMADMAESLGINERSVRRIAEKIKKENLQNAKDGWLLVSGNFGYKITTNVDEIKTYVQRIHGQAISLLVQVKSAEKYLKHEDAKRLCLLFKD